MGNEVLTKVYDLQPIPMVDQDTGEKIKLSLRKMSFRREVDLLPADKLKAHEHFVKAGVLDPNRAVYEAVLWYNKLLEDPRFWESFRFSTQIEYLAFYGLPDGQTLARWQVMVSMFERSTFLLLGPDVLRYMMRKVENYETTQKKRREAYKNMFDQYCSFYEAFDKLSFYDMIERYIIQTYEEPLAQAEGKTHEQWKRDKRRGKKGTKQAAAPTAVSVRETDALQQETMIIAPPAEQQEAPTAAPFEVKKVTAPMLSASAPAGSAYQETAPTRTAEMVLEVEHQAEGKSKVPQRPPLPKEQVHECQFCKEKTFIIKELIVYIHQLEAVAERHHIEKAMPCRPKSVAHLL